MRGQDRSARGSVLSKDRADKKNQKKISEMPIQKTYILPDRTIKINGVEFTPISDLAYPSNYHHALELIKSGKSEKNIFRQLIRKDLFFFIFFIMKIPTANHRFVVDACNEVQMGPMNRTLDIWGREHFKAVGITELVPTPDGWRKHGELEPGDYVFNPEGKPVKVIAKTEVFEDSDCFSVKFSDGYRVVVSGDHLWRVGKKSKRRIKGATSDKRHYRDYSTLSTKGLSEHSHEPDKRYSVDLAQCVEFSEKELLIPPYTLGAWLGDGTSSCGGFTCADPEIVERIREDGFTVSHHAHYKKKYAYTIYKLRPKLRQLDVLNNKHIPEIYLQASKQQRLELLRGLMDTDGTCDVRGTATFVQKRPELAGGVFQLAASLGLNPNIRSHESTLVDGRPYHFWQVSFQSYLDTPVFALSRKMVHAKTGEKRRGKFIVSVDKVLSIPTSCIQVASKDGLYLIGEKYTTTHNSSIITTARAIQTVLNDPNQRIGIFSHSREIAKGFLGQIRQVLEGSEMLYDCFADVLYADPRRESEKWTDEKLTVKRDSFAKEATFEAWGLIDSMPTSKHFTGRIYDDIETDANVNTDALIAKTKSQFHLSHNLGMEGGWHWVIGTHHHHQSILQELRNAKHTKTGEPFYTVRIKPSTVNGEFNGAPVMYSEEWLEERRQDKHIFACQHLCNPTPQGSQSLDKELLRRINPKSIPKRLFKFMIVDQAGERKSDTRDGDWWAMTVVGVEPYLDDLGASGIYILDMGGGILTHAEAMDEVVRVYMRNGRILKLGVEKTGITTTEIHIANKLKTKGRHVSVKRGNLQVLTPKGRKKSDRIESNLQWPLVNGKVYFSTAIEDTFYERLCNEMDKFPFWNDDFLDTLAYTYDLLADFNFYHRPEVKPEREMDLYERIAGKRRNQWSLGPHGWMGR